MQYTKLFSGADQDEGGQLGGLARGIVQQNFRHLGLGIGDSIGHAQDIAGEIVHIHHDGLDTGGLIDLIADPAGIFGQTDAEFAVLGESTVLEAVQTPDFIAGDLVEDAFLAENLADSGADGCPDDLPRTAVVDGELHLPHAVLLLSCLNVLTSSQKIK